jgi:hypothetical protein
VQTSNLTGTPFGASPERDTRADVVANGTKYLTQVAQQKDAAAKISDVEVIFWRTATKPQSAEAYQKLVTDNLAKAGYTYHVTNTQQGDSHTATTFTADSANAHVIGFWQAGATGLFLTWGHVSGGGLPAPPPVAAPPAVAGDDKDAQIAELKRKLAEMQAGKAAPADQQPAVAAQPAVAQPDPAHPAQALAASNIPIQPIEKSPYVNKAADGTLAVATKDGAPVEGTKLSQHDMEIGSPWLAVGPDGVIHLVFVEKHRTTYALAVYYRSSSDTGKPWSEAKNLTEEMPGFGIGRCQVLVDAQNRVYVFFRVSLKETWGAGYAPSANNQHTNLYYRMLQGGKWSKAVAVHPLGTEATQQTGGSISSWAGIDAAERAQVVWNAVPDKTVHPDLINPVMGKLQWLYNGIFAGEIFQASLDGPAPTAPRQVFMAPIGGTKKDNTGLYCDGYDALNGYFDSNGAPHLIGQVARTHDQHAGKTRYEILENGKPGQVFDLPDLSFHAWYDPCRLLVDAKGKRHVIALYLAGEHPNVRDYVVGSDDEPATIVAAQGIKGVIAGFQAWQGPGGHMVVLTQSRKESMGLNDGFVSVSDGTQWSAPVCITNNDGRKTWGTKNTGAIGSVSHGTAFNAGIGAAAYDRTGHLILAQVNSEHGTFGSSVGGVVVASGSSDKPMLFFYRF